MPTSEHDSRNSGKIHQQSANKLIRQYYPEMEEAKRSEILNSDFDHIEGFVLVEEFLKMAANTLSILLADCGVVLPKNFIDIILFDSEPEITLASAIEKCQAIGFNQGESGTAALAVITNVHDLWVWNFMDHFFISDRLYKNYWFMPLELVGIDELKRYYECYVEPLLQLFLPNISFDFVERAYINLQDAFLVKYAIRDKESLLKALLEKIDCDAWASGIRFSIKNDPVVRERVADQIITHNPVLQV